MNLLFQVSSLMPLMRSYFRSLACSTHKVNPIPLAKAMTLGLAYFLGEKCGWKVTLPVEVCRDLSVTENREQERCSKAKEKEGLSVLSWQETILAFTPCTGTVYVVDFDFKVCGLMVMLPLFYNEGFWLVHFYATCCLMCDLIM